MTKIATPLFGHITASAEWNELTDKAAFTLHAALRPDADARTRYEAKTRYQRLVRRRKALRDQANEAMTAFDAKAREIADLRRHAFATAPAGGSLRALMN